jgi:hypothetical protein
VDSITQRSFNTIPAFWLRQDDRAFYEAYDKIARSSQAIVDFIQGGARPNFASIFKMSKVNNMAALRESLADLPDVQADAVASSTPTEPQSNSIQKNVFEEFQMMKPGASANIWHQQNVTAPAEAQPFILEAFTAAYMGDVAKIEDITNREDLPVPLLSTVDFFGNSLILCAALNPAVDSDVAEKIIRMLIIKALQGNPPPPPQCT